MSTETENRFGRLAASFLIAVVFFLGLELVRINFEWRHLAGAILLGTLFLYMISSYEDEKQGRSLGDDGSEDIS